MTPEAYFEQELARLREQFDAGDFRAIPEAVALLAAREPEWPDWLIHAVMHALSVAFEHGGATGKGKTGGFVIRAKRADIDAKRHQVAFMCLTVRKSHETRADAFAEAQALLQGTFAQGSPGAIEDSFNRVQAATRKKG